MNTRTKPTTPAFPAKLTGPCEAYGLEADATQVIEFSGMTLRDYFAAKAMGGMCMGAPIPQKNELTQIANRSYAMADAMLEAREL